MNGNMSVFVICVETIMYLLLYNLCGYNFNFWLLKTILSYVFETLLPSTNPSFPLVETYFLSSGNSMLLFGAFFLLLKTMIKITENQF